MAYAKIFLLSLMAPTGVVATSSVSAADSTHSKSELTEVVVTASKVAQPLRQVGVSIDVLSERDLQQRNKTSLADILRTVPGISVSNSGGLGKATSVFMRGEDSFRTRLYIDGLAITDTTATQTSPRFDSLLNQQLGRVEILKGPQALMYGADSGGVIAVFSPEASAPLNADVAVEAGSFNTQNISANVRGKTDALNYFVSGGFLNTAGINARVDDQTADNDGFRNANIHIKARAKINDQQSMGLVSRSNSSANEYDGCYDANYARFDSCDDSANSNAARLDWQYKTEQFSQELALTHYGIEHERYLAAGSAKAEEVEGGSDEAQYFAHYQINSQVAASLGLVAKQEVFTQVITGGGYKADEERESYAVFSEWLINPSEQFSYSIGGRWDTNPDFGSHSSYRLAGAYLIPIQGPQLKWRAATSTGFRLPSFYEIYFNNHAAFDLAGTQKTFTSETSRGVETGLDASWQRFTLSATVFSAKIDKEIFYDLLNYSGYVQAEGESKSSGLELSSQWQMTDGLSWRLGYTHLETEQNSSPLAGSSARTEKVQRPENSYTLGMHLELFQGASSTDIQYRSAFNQRAFGGKLMEDYAVLDAQTSWQFNLSTQAYIRIVNGLDENYQEVQGYNTAPLNAYAGLKLAF